jgi:hypothetical protein
VIDLSARRLFRARHKAIIEEIGPVRAEGTIATLGRRAAFTDARLVDVHGCLYASATSSILVMQPTWRQWRSLAKDVRSLVPTT